MKVRCIANSGEFLRNFEYEPLVKEKMGRFGATGNTEYGELTLRKEYLVMGILIFKDFQGYLIDDGYA